MIQAIIFDYDGILVDSFPIGWAVYNEIAQEIKHLEWTAEELKKIFLNPWNENYDAWKLTHEQRKRCEYIYKNRTIELGKRVQPIPGVKETLAELKKHYRLILGSGTYTAIILPRLKELGIAHYFEQIIGLEDHKAAKPDAKILNLCVEKLNLSKNEIVHVADMVSDISMGRAAGVKTIIMPTYSWNAEEDIIKAQPDMLIKDMKELPQVLKGLTTKI